MRKLLSGRRAAFLELLKKKRRGIIAAVLVLLPVLMIASDEISARLNTVTNEEINVLYFGQAEIKVVEDFDGWEHKVVKLAAETGTGYVPGVARVMLVPYVLDEASEHYIPCELGALSRPEDNKMILGDIVLEFAEDWEEHWFFQDGFFYYRTVLYPETGKNETTELLTRVSLLDSAAEQKYSADRVSVKVEVLASILQAEGSAPDTGSVLASAWGVKVSGSTVSALT